MIIYIKISSEFSNTSTVKGDKKKFEIRLDGVEASHLYLDARYTIVDEYLNKFWLIL